MTHLMLLKRAGGKLGVPQFQAWQRFQKDRPPSAAKLKTVLLGSEPE